MQASERKFIFSHNERRLISLKANNTIPRFNVSRSEWATHNGDARYADSKNEHQQEHSARFASICMFRPFALSLH